MSKKVYLGDGAYAFHDGLMIGLMCERENGENVVYLEPQVLQEFIRFIEKSHGVKITIEEARDA